MKSEELLSALKQNPFVLAPMASITDMPFRTFMRGLGTGIVISELVSANGIRFGGEKTLKLLTYCDQERPVGIQLFGENVENLAYSASYVEQQGADFIDMNFGCPVKKVVKKGAGSAILKDLVQLRTVLRAVKSATHLPVTIKIRTGWDHETKNADEVAQVAYDEGITWVAVHGRTRSQAYAGEADWDYIKSVKEKSPIPILGNGDITSATIANARMKESGCDGVMIGRGCLKDPWIFADSISLYNASDKPLRRPYTSLIEELTGAICDFHDEKVGLIQLRKFAMWYSSGYHGAAQFRKELFASTDFKQTYQKTLAYYSKLDHGRRLDTSKEAFLMGGHG